MAAKQIPAQVADRFNQMQTWLQQQFGDYHIRIESLPGDASFRHYHRLYLTKDDGSAKVSDLAAGSAVTHGNEEVHSDADGKSVADLVYVVMDAPPERESITEFVAVAELMSQRINVPDLIAKDMTRGFLVLQDFGKREFAQVLKQASAEQIDKLYLKAMQTLVKLQTLEVSSSQQQANLPDYDAALLTREMGLFTEWFLPYFGISMSPEIQQAWSDLQSWLIDAIAQQPKVVVHRDYHSRNLMLDHSRNLTLDQGEDTLELGVIDFQDAVIGAYSYDLVSLLRDAYVSWQEPWVAEQIEQFRQLLSEEPKRVIAAVPSQEQCYIDVSVMGVQRHLKVLGIFVRLAQRDGKLKYLADLPKVMRDLRFELGHLVSLPDDPISRQVQPFYRWLEAEVVPVFEQSMRQAVR